MWIVEQPKKEAKIFCECDLLSKKKGGQILTQSHMQLEDYYLSSNQNSPHHQFHI